MDKEKNDTATASPLFSILIPSWNNLPFLRLCVESLRRYSEVDSQIIVHVNDGSDGTLQWVREQGLDYTYSPENIGVCMAMNMMRTKVKGEYMVFLNDDMYVLPRWDTALLKEIKALPDNRFFLSSTTIQPHTPGCVIVADYGDTPETFRLDDLLRDYRSLPMPDWMGATLPPNVVHRDIWDLAGGYSVEYSPGMYSDPDFTAKLWLCGIRFMKGVSASRVYHFETKSTGRIKKNDGRRQFLMKWGITSSTFRRAMTYKRKPYSGELVNTYDSSILSGGKIRSRLEALRSVLAGKFGPLWKFTDATPLSEAPRKKGGRG